MKVVWSKNRTYIVLTTIFLGVCNAIMGLYELAIGTILCVPLMFYFAHKEYGDKGDNS